MSELNETNVSRVAKFYSGRNRLSKNQVYSNTDQEIIEITADRVLLILQSHESRIGDKKCWNTPLALFLSIGATLATADFKDVLGTDAATWKAVFIMGLILSGIWLFRSVIKAYNMKTGSHADIVEEMKNARSKG